MRQRFVVPQMHGDPACGARGPSGEPALQRGVARSQHEQLRAVVLQLRVQPRQQVGALLLRQPSDEREQGRVGRFAQSDVTLQRELVGPTRIDRRLHRVAIDDVRVGLRVPRFAIDAVGDAVQRRRPHPQHALQPFAERRRLDLARVRRAHGGDHIRIQQPGLHEGKAAVELERVQVPGLRRQAQRVELPTPEHALVGEVVDREHDRRGPRRSRAVQMHRRKARVPVVEMDHLRRPASDAGHAPQREHRDGLRKTSEAPRVVRVLVAIFVGVRATGARVQRGVIEQPRSHSGAAGRSDPSLPQRHVLPTDRQARDGASILQPFQGTAVGDRQQPDVDTARGQRLRQSAGHVGQSSGLRKRQRLGGGEQQAQRRGAHSPRSITATQPSS